MTTAPPRLPGGGAAPPIPARPLPVAVAVVAILANTQGQEIWAAALVLIVSVWAVDLGSAFSARGREFPTLAVVVTAAGSAMAAHVAGGAGYALSLVLAVVVGMGWAVAFPQYRHVEVFTPPVMVSLFAGLGTASLVLARSAHTPEPNAANVFLVSVVAATVLGAMVERMPPLPLLDAFSVTALGAVLSAVAAALGWERDLDAPRFRAVWMGVLGVGTLMLVCHCVVVNHEQILEEISSGATSHDDIADRCGAGTRCGGCRVTIEQLLYVHTPTRALAA